MLCLLFDIRKPELYSFKVSRMFQNYFLSNFLLLAVAILCSGCIEHRPPQVSRRDRPVTAQLISLNEQVKGIIADTNRTPYERRGGLANNRQAVYAMMAQALIEDASDLRLAASVLFQASDGSNPEARAIAVILANQALSEAPPADKPPIQALIDSLAKFPN